MKISIVTPSFNQGRFLERTLKSVIDQNYPSVEHIVYDGGSSDESVTLLKKYDAHLAHWKSEVDRGQTDAVNKGLYHATGEVVGWLNSDDIYYPGAFEAVIAHFTSHPDSNFVFGMADHIDVDDNVIEPYYTENWSYERLKQLCFICQPAVFFRRTVLEKYGFLDESLNYCMDYEYWLRCGAHEKFAYLKSPLAGSRIYPENKTIGSKVYVIREILEMLKSKFQRIDNGWLVQHAIAEAKARVNGNGILHMAAKAAFANVVWQKSLWRYNREIYPIVPGQLLAQLPLIPRKYREILAKPSGTKSFM